MACAHGAAVKANPAVTFPLAVDENTPAFLFPINLSHLGSQGDPLAMGVTVTAGIASKFGKTVVSGQQLFDLVGNLSFELAETVRSQAQGNSWTMGGPAENIASALANMMQAIIGKLVELKLIDKPINFKYIIALHSHGEAGLGGKTLNVTSWGGIYDVDSKQIVSYIDSVDTYANTAEAVMGQLPSTYNNIISQLIQGSAAAKPEEKKANAVLLPQGVKSTAAAAY
jgi:hypothetical protein